MEYKFYLRDTTSPRKLEKLYVLDVRRTKMWFHRQMSGLYGILKIG
jgi:hypothetical protein